MAEGWTGIGYAEQAGRYLFACSEPHCFRRLTFTSHEEALAEKENHKCPYWGGETKVAWSVTKTLVQQLWDKLDLSMDVIRDDTQADEVKHDEKVRARAIAECIAIFMPPFFTTANDVASEALRRHKAKQAGEEYETPGLGARRYEAAVRNDKPRRVSVPQNQPTLGGLDDKSKTAIKFALESGFFTPEQLSKTYKVSVEVIHQIKDS